MESLPGFQTGAQSIFARVNMHFQSFFSKRDMTPAMLASGISMDYLIHQINRSHPIMVMPGGSRHKITRHQAMHFQKIS
jgi:hypothetical protein